jgi:hypothetical protein
MGQEDYWRIQFEQQQSRLRHPGSKMKGQLLVLGAEAWELTGQEWDRPVDIRNFVHR